MRVSLEQAVALTFAASLGAATGCDGCHGGTPYTPYKLEAASASAASTPDSGQAGEALTDGGPLFAAVEGVAAPGDGKTWPLDGATIAAPVGRVFATGLAADLDADGKQDLLVWARAPDGMRGELCFVSGAAPSVIATLAALPAQVGGHGCTTSTRIAQIGNRTAALDFIATCTEPMPDRATQWIAVIGLPDAKQNDGARVPTLRLEARARPANEGETLALGVGARDEDGDGRDDITFTFALSGAVPPFTAPERPVASLVRFFDRSAGMSRDPSEPEASMRAAANALGAKAHSKASIAAEAMAIRDLHRAVCAEDGAPLVETSAGVIQCGPASSLEEAIFAEGVSALSHSNPAGAIAAALRLERIGTSSLGRLKDLDRQLTKSVASKPANVVHRVGAKPDVASGSASFGPLHFEASGALLVRAKEGVVRVDGASFAEAPATDVTPWPASIDFPIAAPSFRLTLASQRCESPTLSAFLEPRGDSANTHRLVPLPIRTPVSEAGAPIAETACGSIASVALTPIDADDAQGLVMAIGADVVSIDATPRASLVAPRERGTPIAGSARSPDGASFAIPTARGVLVETAGSRPRLWSGAEVIGASACTAANGGARIACVVGGVAEILEAP